jgi:hypothetical protein
MIEGESATGGNRPGAGAPPEPKPGQPRTKSGTTLPSGSFRYAARSLTRKRVLSRAFLFGRFKEAKDDTFVQQAMPQRPIAHGGMSQAQLVDLIAAQEGKITWAEYFRKWGGRGPSLQ